VTNSVDRAHDDLKEREVVAPPVLHGPDKPQLEGRCQVSEVRDLLLRRQWEVLDQGNILLPLKVSCHRAFEVLLGMDFLEVVPQLLLGLGRVDRRDVAIKPALEVLGKTLRRSKEAVDEAHHGWSEGRRRALDDATLACQLLDHKS
jgi:hypothetical protein